MRRTPATRHRIGGSPGRVVGLFLLYAALHSALASREAKDLAGALLGERHRNGLYRFGYNAQAVLLFGWAARVFCRLPDRTLYRVPTPWAWLMQAGQLSGIGLMLAAAWGVGIARITGIASVKAFLAGAAPPREPEAQGPAPGPTGDLGIVGPFRFTRHPANWGPVPVVLLFPHMTVNRATLAVLSVVYLVLGSVHEERRLRVAYGPAYERYQQRAPFLIGNPLR
jgi:methanethiol S-methyltransferase